MASTFLQRTKELKAANPTMSGVEAARLARQEITPPKTTTAAPIVNTTGLPAWFNFWPWGGFWWGDDSAPSIDYNNNVISSWQKGDSMYIPEAAALPGSPTAPAKRIVSNTTPPSTTNTQGNSSTVTWGGYGTWGTSTVNPTNKNWLIEGKTNQVLGDVMNNYDKNKTLDNTQLEETKLAVEVNAMEVDTELKRKQLEDIDLAKEEDRIQKQKAADDANNLMALQEKERARNEASIAMAESKSEAAERELAIANDVELQKSNVAFAKLGLTLSTAAATSAQQIYTTWVYNLSKLKSENAYANANLRVEVAKVEFDHTTAVNKIINDSSSKSYTIRKTLNDDINKINNSIIDNRLSRVEKLNAVMDKYQKEVETNEENTLKLIKGAATTLDDITKSMYDTLKTKESFGQDKINTVATNGKWFTMTPAEKIKYEQTAWLPKGTVNSQIKASIGKWVVKELEGVANLSAGKINWVIDEALKLMDTWAYGMEAAIAVALTNSPEYQTQLKLAQAKKNKVGGSWGKASTKAWFVDTVKWDDGKWYNRYKDPTTWKVTSEVSDKQFDEGGKINTLKPSDPNEEI